MNAKRVKCTRIKSKVNLNLLLRDIFINMMGFSIQKSFQRRLILNEDVRETDGLSNNYDLLGSILPYEGTDSYELLNSYLYFKRLFKRLVRSVSIIHDVNIIGTYNRNYYCNIRCILLLDDDSKIIKFYLDKDLSVKSSFHHMNNDREFSYIIVDNICSSEDLSDVIIYDSLLTPVEGWSEKEYLSSRGSVLGIWTDLFNWMERVDALFHINLKKKGFNVPDWDIMMSSLNSPKRNKKIKEV